MIEGKKHINGSKTSRLQNKSEMCSQGFISWPTQWTNLVGFIGGHLPGKPFGPGDTDGTTIVKSNGPGTLLFSIQFTKFTLDHLVIILTHFHKCFWKTESLKKPTQ